uniref:hypothetical protein n=1 Tax=Escherichia coli TaxID=562 RepID=UPI0019549EA3
LVAVVKDMPASREAAAKALVALVGEEIIPEWSSPFGYVSRIDPSFTTSPASFDDVALSTIAADVTQHLF